MKIGRAKDIRPFCVVDGWQRKADRPGQRVSKHEAWEKALPNGEILRTVISKGRGALPKSLFAAIVKRQLHVSEAEFWVAVDTGTPPTREEAMAVSAPRIPHEVVRRLLTRGYSLCELKGLDAEQAGELLDEE